MQLEPQDAFGEYDPDLVKVEARGRFPEPLEVGMQFEGTPEEGDDDLDSLIYTVTDVAEDKVVLDGNHPLAGMALRFALNVKEVREPPRTRWNTSTRMAPTVLKSSMRTTKSRARTQARRCTEAFVEVDLNDMKQGAGNLLRLCFISRDVS